MIGTSDSLCLTAATIGALCLSAVSVAKAQNLPQRADHLTWGAQRVEAGNQDDPAYDLYRKGYGLVLQGRWEQAYKLFTELRREYPASDYRDDAAYWSAYSLKHVRPKAALEAYHSFLEQYRQSSYFDDAVADLEEIEVAYEQGSTPRVTAAPDGNLSVTITPGLRKLERELRKASRVYRRMGVPMVLRVEETLDAETRLRMEALYTIGETAKDEQAFRTLRRVAVTHEEPVALREAALEALVSFPEQEVMPVLLEIARKDTNAQMQSYAVDLIAESPADTGRKLDLLIDLYRTLPDSRREQRQTIFYTIADFGTEPAVNFLGDIALTSPDFEVRREAVYYLGSIGGPNARSLLIKVLLEK